MEKMYMLNNVFVNWNGNSFEDYASSVNCCAKHLAQAIQDWVVAKGEDPANPDDELCVIVAPSEDKAPCNWCED